MSELTDEQLRLRAAYPAVRALTDELLTLRARKSPATTQLVNLSKSLLDDANAECAELRARVAQLEAALTPIEWYVALLPKETPDYMPMKADITGSGDLTVGDLRATAAAIRGRP